MTLWWCYPGDQGSGPFDVALTEAADVQAACQVFGERWPSPCVHQLHALPEGWTAPAPGELRYERAERLPSFYDQYRRPRRADGSGYDVHRMGREDIDVS